MSKLCIVGIGPGSKDYLTQIAIKTVENSDFIIGSQRALDLFENTSQKIIFNVKNLEEFLYKSVDLVNEGFNVSLLSTGDPGFSGLLKPILRIAKEKNLDEKAIEVFPGISSLQLASAKTHIPWDEANIMTFHGRDDQSAILDIIENNSDTKESINSKPSIILPSRSVKDFVKFLIDSGADENRKITVCERLSYLDEKIVDTTLKDVLNSNFSYMCILVIY
ncbi:MAG: cobalt-precorrin-7 (C(5))-methyltransferase [Methanobrevibacter sp.]|nr:cobalt-precorrin-7 (C(5))-methyltransferase [Methanobrevibacter sp.]